MTIGFYKREGNKPHPIGVTETVPTDKHVSRSALGNLVLLTDSHKNKGTRTGFHANC
jgi:hypothetical protein